MIVGLASIAAVLIVLLAASVKFARTHERVIAIRLARLQPEPKGPGLFLVMPIIDRVIRVDLTKETLADAVGAHNLVNEEVTIDEEGVARVGPGMAWPARSDDGAPLAPGSQMRVERVDDDLRLVVGSLSSPNREEVS